MTYKLYGYPKTGSCAPQGLLEEAGAKYELINVDLDAGEQKQAWFLALNPLGQVPVLVTPEGRVLTESGAIVLHLAERFADRGLIPEPGSAARDAFYRWLFFMATNLYTADLRHYYADRFTTDPAGAAAVAAQGLHDMDAQFALMNEHLGARTWLLGDTYCALDIYLTMLMSWHPDPAALARANRALAGLRDRVLARPAIARIAEEHSLAG